MGLFRKKKKQEGGGQQPGHNPLLDDKQKADIIINSIGDGVVLVGSDNIITMFNPGASKITGWDAKETIGLDYRSVVKFVDEKGQALEDNLHPINKVLESSKATRYDTAVLVKKDGKALSVDVSVSPLLDADTRVIGVIAVLRDVEEQRKQEKQRADFISTASHEMRTPVAAIEGYLALALNERVTKIDAKGRSYLEKAHASTKHLGKLFQDLLTSAKAEDGRLANHPMVIEVGDFVEHLVDDLKFAAEKKGLLLELLMGGHQRTDSTTLDVSKKVIKPLLYVHADPDRLREVVTNLFDNAVKYTESGRISIGITGDSEVVQFHISDTGPGIPKEDVKHLFQKFYRVDTSATRTIGGTGLGLYICRKIIELYGGRIWAESEVDKGSTFYINLPRLSSEKAAELQAQENRVPSVIQNEKI